MAVFIFAISMFSGSFFPHYRAMRAMFPERHDVSRLASSSEPLGGAPAEPAGVRHEHKFVLTDEFAQLSSQHSENTAATLARTLRVAAQISLAMRLRCPSDMM